MRVPSKNKRSSLQTILLIAFYRIKNDLFHYSYFIIVVSAFLLLVNPKFCYLLLISFLIFSLYIIYSISLNSKVSLEARLKAISLKSKNSLSNLSNSSYTSSQTHKPPLFPNKSAVLTNNSPEKKSLMSLSQIRQKIPKERIKRIREKMRNLVEKVKKILKNPKKPISSKTLYMTRIMNEETGKKLFGDGNRVFQITKRKKTPNPSKISGEEIPIRRNSRRTMSSPKIKTQEVLLIRPPSIASYSRSVNLHPQNVRKRRVGVRSLSKSKSLTSQIPAYFLEQHNRLHSEADESFRDLGIKKYISEWISRCKSWVFDCLISSFFHRNMRNLIEINQILEAHLDLRLKEFEFFYHHKEKRNHYCKTVSLNEIEGVLRVLPKNFACGKELEGLLAERNRLDALMNVKGWDTVEIR